MMAEVMMDTSSTAIGDAYQWLYWECSSCYLYIGHHLQVPSFAVVYSTGVLESYIDLLLQGNLIYMQCFQRY